MYFLGHGESRVKYMHVTVGMDKPLGRLFVVRRLGVDKDLIRSGILNTPNNVGKKSVNDAGPQ